MPSMHQTIDSSPSFVEHIDDLRSLVVVCGISDHSLLSEDVKEELKSAGEGGFICISGNDVSTKCTIFIKNSSSHYLVFKCLPWVTTSTSFQVSNTYGLVCPSTEHEVVISLLGNAKEFSYPQDELDNVFPQFGIKVVDIGINPPSAALADVFYSTQIRTVSIAKINLKLIRTDDGIVDNTASAAAVDENAEDVYDQNVIGRLDIQQEDDGDDVPVITAPNRIISKCQDILINGGLSAEDSAIHSKFQELIRSIDVNNTNGAAEKIVDKLIEGGLCMSLCPNLAAAFCKRRVKAARGAHVRGGAVSSKPQREFTDRSGGEGGADGDVQMALAEPSRKREADDEHDEQVAKKVTKPSSEEQPQLQTQLDAEQERANRAEASSAAALGQLRDAVRDVERAETEANRFKADANQVKAELKDELKKNDDMKLRITELESQKAQVEAEAAAARQVVENNPLLQLLDVSDQKMDHIRYMEATLRPDAPPFMEMMLLFKRSQVEGTEYTGDLYPISGILEKSNYLRMTSSGDWIGGGGRLISNRGEYSSKHLDPVNHMFCRIKSLLYRLETIINDHDPSYERVVNEDSDDDDEEGSDENVESDDESNVVLRLTGWSWDMIRAYLSLLEEYLTNIGSSLDDFMNCNQYNPNKIELNHATDIMRHLTWDLGTIPTQEQKELFIKKMCSPLILFPGNKRMNALVHNRPFYNLRYGRIPGTLIDDWHVDPSQDNVEATRQTRTDMILVGVLQMVTPTLAGSPILRRNTSFESALIEDESEDDEMSEDDSLVEVGSLEIALLAAKSTTGKVTLVYLGEDSAPLFAVKDSRDDVVGYANLHDEKAVLEFMNGPGRHVDGIARVSVEDGIEEEGELQWPGGRIVKKNKKNLLQFTAIKVPQRHAREVIQGLTTLGSYRNQIPPSVLNADLIIAEASKLEKIHQFIQAKNSPDIASESPEIRNIAELLQAVGSPWHAHGSNLNQNANELQESWDSKMEVFRTFRQIFGGITNNKLTKYLRGNGPGRSVALAAYKAAFPQALWYWLKHEKSTRFAIYATNGQTYNNRIWSHIQMGTWNSSLNIDWNGSVPINEGAPERNEIIIMRADTVNIAAPTRDETLAVLGNTNLCLSVMAVSSSTAYDASCEGTSCKMTFSKAVSNNDQGIRTTIQWPGRLLMKRDGNIRNKWYTRSDDGLKYIARSTVSTDPSEGIYCNPDILPAPFRFVLDEHYCTPAGNRSKSALSAEALETIHNANYNQYRTDGVVPVISGFRYLREGR